MTEYANKKEFAVDRMVQNGLLITRKHSDAKSAMTSMISNQMYGFDGFFITCRPQMKMLKVKFFGRGCLIPTEDCNVKFWLHAPVLVYNLAGNRFFHTDDSSHCFGLLRFFDQGFEDSTLFEILSRLKKSILRWVEEQAKYKYLCSKELVPTIWSNPRWLLASGILGTEETIALKERWNIQ